MTDTLLPAFTGTCDFCGTDTVAFEHYLIHPLGPFTATRPTNGGGSDWLATWCAECGPKHRK